MPIRDPLLDPWHQKMVAAYEGDTERWVGVNRSLRDAILDHALRTTAYYREGIRPGTPWEEIPILTKSDVRGHLPELLAEGVPEARRFEDRTSGSTGEPLRFFRDTSQGPLENVSADRFFRGLWGIPDGAATVSVSGRFRMVRGKRSRVPGSMAGLASAPTGGPPFRQVPAFALDEKTVIRELRVWDRLHPFVLLGYPSALDYVATVLDDRGLGLSSPPAGIVTISETLAEQTRLRLERVFGCPVNSRYSSNELQRMGGTLPASRRYIINPLLHHLEVVDEEGRAVGPGESGRVVVTDLNNQVQPFIRYDTGDLATRSTDGYVGGFLLLDEILGRASEVIRLPSGRTISAVLLGQRLFVMEEFERFVALYQCAQTGPNALELRVVWRGSPPPEVPGAVVAAVRGLTDDDTDVRLRAVSELERLPSGKAWVVRRELD